MELEDIKKVWKEQKTTSFSRAEILIMLKQKTSSVAKWIFYISLVEFAFWILLSFILPDSQKNFSEHVNSRVNLLFYANYSIVIAFILIFFLNFRKIRAEQSTAQLLKNIFKTRKTVQCYIIYNLSMVVISIVLTFIWIFSYDYASLPIPKGIKMSLPIWIFFFLIALLFIFVIFTILFFFYRLLYGFLLRRLKKNYQEIQQLQ